MLLHLGADISVYAKDVVMIMDAVRMKSAPQTQLFLAAAQRNGQLTALSKDEPKSYVLIQRPHATARLFASPISAVTLHKRCSRARRGV